MDFFYRNVIFVYIFLGKYPHGHTSDFLLAGHAVSLTLNLCSLPESFVNVLVHLGILNILVDLKKCPFIGVLEIVIRP